MRETDPAGATDGDSPPADFDEYVLVRPLGRGSTGRVYLGHDTMLDRPVAIKWTCALRSDATARVRFLIEARAIARLHHPNVVSVHRVGQVAGRPYLVTEFVEGEGLEALRKPLPPEQVVQIGIGLARGLRAAHLRGVLHRDIKPANIILARDGQVKLLDFGLAKLLGEAPAPLAQGGAGAPPPAEGTTPAEALHETQDLGPAPSLGAGPQLTLTGGLVGTPLYMAPEIWERAPASPRSDLYSLGAVLYELCSGAPPHRGADLEELRRSVLHRDVALAEAAPACDPRLCAIVERCLQRDPERRFASADELCRALEQLPTGGAARPPAGSPYRGLAPFETEQKDVFFGRTAEIHAVLQLLREGPLVLVTGDSGVGKSSLCRAGVLPRCADPGLPAGRRWTAITAVPGRQPVLALALTLAPVLAAEADALAADLREAPSRLVERLRALGPRAGLLIFLDQMEELLTQSDPAEAAALAAALGALLASAGGSGRDPAVRVLVTVRGDYLTRLAGLLRLGDELLRGIYILRALPAEGLREAIVGPARAAGFTFESPRMIQQLIDATVGADGGLPLLQFALSELWEARDARRRLIPATALQRLGGVTGALARHADGVLAGLRPEEQAAARRVLLQLVRPDGTRACLPQGRLSLGRQGDDAALNALVRGRLLIARKDQAGESAYEIAHEALVQGWHTLRDWLDASRGQRAVRHRLEGAAAEWERLGRARESLWRERQLREVDGAGISPDELGPREATFLATSRRHARDRRRLGLLLGVGVPLLLSGAGVMLGRARQERQRAEELAQAERGAKAASLAQQPGMEGEALLAGLQAVLPSWQGGRPPPRLATEGLMAAVAAGRRSLPLSGHTGSVMMGFFSSDGGRIVTAGEDTTARIWDARTGQPLHVVRHELLTHASFSPDGGRILTASGDGRLRVWDVGAADPRWTREGHGATINTAAFSPDGETILSTSDDHTGRLWEARTGRPLHVLRGHRSDVLFAAFSPDSARVATGGGDHTVRLWDGRTGAPLATLVGHTGSIQSLGSVAFSPDGGRLASGSMDHTVRLWEVRSGRPLATLSGHAGPLRCVAFSPDGLVVASSSADGTARLWDGWTGAPQAVLQGHTGNVHTVAFSPDGRRVVTAGRDGTARVWDVGTGQGLTTLRGHKGAVLFARFSPDGGSILTGGVDHIARRWDARGEAHLTMLNAHQAGIQAASFSPDGSLVATASVDTTARLWDGLTGRHRATLSGHSDVVQHLAFAPAGQVIATASHDGTARLWDGRTGRPLRTLRGHRGQVISVAFSPDGERVVTASHDRGARLWRVRDGQLLAVLRGHEDALDLAVFSRDGARIATASYDQTARLWDGRTGQPLLTLRGHTGWVLDLAFSPDGMRLASAGLDRSARIWDGRAGQSLAVLQGHAGYVWRVAYSPDGAQVLTSGTDDTVRLWDARTGAPRGTFGGSAEKMYVGGFSPDGARIVTGGRDGSAQLWDRETGRRLLRLEGQTRLINVVTFSPDGARLLTASMDGSARLWDVRTGQPLAVVGNPVEPARPGAEQGPGQAAASLEESFAAACKLLRYQPQFEQVQEVCLRQLRPLWQAVR